MNEEFPHQELYEETASWVRYAVIFAADCDPTAVAEHHEDDPTSAFAALSIALGQEAATRTRIARNEGRDFYPVAFVEAAAVFFNRYPAPTLHDLVEAGQLESDAIAGK